jgi:PIN domain nuclease of toxin-antitoxin system
MIGEEKRALLLDTHVWVWYVENESKRFSRRIVSQVEAAVARGALLVSVISVWEVAQLEAVRRLELTMSARAWMARALSFPGLRLCDLSPSIAIDSTQLPGSIHRDPADRILVATARGTGATLVTCDEKILAYAREGHVKALNATP